MARLFGTDGVAALQNEELTPLLAMQLWPGRRDRTDKGK